MPATVLIIDDESANLAVLAQILQSQYRVRAANSGERGLAVAAVEPKPDLILLDVMMPGLDGYAVLERLQGNAASRDIPVVFVTALDSTEDETRGLELGAVDYIAKPYHPTILLARVRTHIELKRARDRLTNQNAYLEAEVARRIKETQAVQTQLLQSEKLAALGQLAAGVAHEINTPVGYISSNMGTLDVYLQDIFQLLDACDVLAGACAQDTAGLGQLVDLKASKKIDFLREDIAHLLAESREGLARVARIVGDLKNFSRAGGDETEWANLHDGLDSTLNIVWNEMKYHCSLRKEYGEVPGVLCIPSQINQVFLNLLVNAVQAIPERGEITIRTGRVGDEVFIAIADTGVGIPAEDIPHLFEPFFTTKPVGKGTGLGLSISYAIVKKHGGRIEVESQVGRGTTFKVWLPIAASTIVGTTPAGGADSGGTEGGV